MTTSNRAARIAKLFKVLKKHYQPVPPQGDRLLLEHLLYACCLENGSCEQADEAFAKLQQAYFDWNEIRVTTVSELAETMAALPDAAAAAARLKRCLQALFETYYSFDIESLKKQNIGKAIKELQQCRGARPFAIAYATQHGLGGHAIPINQGAISALLVLGIVNESEAQNYRVPGLERAIGKSKGVEFAALLHQFGADFQASPLAPRLRAMFLEIDPESKQRLPKRGDKKSPAEGPSDQAASAPEEGQPVDQEPSPPPKKRRAKPENATPAPETQSATEPDESGAVLAKKKSETKRIAKRKPR